ncbi:MAG TPA: cysteine desulfurase NifS [Pyrinomonadaceae bacterium]
MIYLDNNATTRVAPEVVAAMQPFLSDFYGNPSSSHRLGRESRKAVERAREQIAETLGASETSEIVFTSCGTESNNWAILGALEMQPDKKHIITTAVEHEAVLKLCQKLERRGCRITLLDVDETGLLDLDRLREALTDDTAIVSAMLANNETGVLFPVAEIARIVKENSDALIHCDAVNAVGKVPVNLKETEIDLLSISGHKFHAPKGVGALFVRKGIDLPSFFIGGNQENARRAGTEAVSQVVALGAACELIKNYEALPKMRTLRDCLENEILKIFPFSRLNGNRENRLPNTANISFAGVEGESILAHLDEKGICVSTGSACNAETHEASTVLRAMNVPYREAMGSIRFSLSRYTTEEEIETTLQILPEIVWKLREMSPLAD